MVSKFVMNVYDADLNLSDANDKKLFLKAIEPSSDNEKYDLTSKKFHNFLSTLTEKLMITLSTGTEISQSLLLLPLDLPELRKCFSVTEKSI